ncbi:uncharacterized protein LOC134202607 isoform X2 [Armigeres subalbatus]|uniref:uncharacterized protein LOC134202607 isoform X2 n=1 Tax=Armigeres subalbatus TaxID=124917 RepID=UPI002ED1D488
METANGERFATSSHSSYFHPIKNKEMERNLGIGEKQPCIPALEASCVLMQVHKTQPADGIIRTAKACRDQKTYEDPPGVIEPRTFVTSAKKCTDQAEFSGGASDSCSTERDPGEDQQSLAEANSLERSPSSSKILLKKSVPCERSRPVEQSLRQTGGRPEQPPGDCLLPEIGSSVTFARTPVLEGSQPMPPNETEFSVGVLSKSSAPDVCYIRQHIRTDPSYENSTRSALFNLTECMASSITRCERSLLAPAKFAGETRIV